MTFGQSLASILNFFLIGYALYVAKTVGIATGSDVIMAGVWLGIVIIVARIIWLVCRAEPPATTKDEGDAS